MARLLSRVGPSRHTPTGQKRPSLLGGLLGLVLLAGLPTAGARGPRRRGGAPDAGAAPLSGGAPARGLDQSLAADLKDVPLADALATVARRLGLQLENQDASEPATHITAKLPPVSAEVLLLVLAWETNREWVAAPGLLRWGPPQGLPRAELTKYRRERTLRLERKTELLRRRLREPVTFRLKVEGVPLADLLGFLQRQLSLPLFLDPRAAAELNAPVRSEFADLTLAQLLDRLLPGERGPASDSRVAEGSAATEHPRPGEGGGGRAGARRAASARSETPSPVGEANRSSTGGPSPLGWAVVGDLVVVSTPAHLYSLRSLSQ
jgi:hypothetical protein